MCLDSWLAFPFTLASSKGEDSASCLDEDLPFAQLEKGLKVLQTNVGGGREPMGCAGAATPGSSAALPSWRMCVSTFPAHALGRQWSVLDKLAFQAPDPPNTRPLCYF